METKHLMVAERKLLPGYIGPLRPKLYLQFSAPSEFPLIESTVIKLFRKGQYFKVPIFLFLFSLFSSNDTCSSRVGRNTVPAAASYEVYILSPPQILS